MVPRAGFRKGDFRGIDCGSNSYSRKEVERLGGHGDRVFLGGASQGCTVALAAWPF